MPEFRSKAEGERKDGVHWPPSQECIGGSLDACQTRSLPHMPKLQDKQVSPFHRNTGGVL